jgi:hypothetical protein
MIEGAKAKLGRAERDRTRESEKLRAKEPSMKLINRAGCFVTGAARSEKDS